MDELLALTLVQELKERQNRGVSPVDRLIDHNYPEQKAFVLDTSDDIVAECTRRAGKSYGLGLRLFRAALKHPGSLAIYIALTRNSAKNIMWPVLSDINRKYGLRAEPKETALVFALPNGSQVLLVGADMKNFIERLRGSKYSEAQIDEAGSFRSHLTSLIDDILKPALIDYQGSLVMAGTPAVIPAGAFYEACKDPQLGYSKFKWSLFQNPYLPRAREFVEKMKAKKGWTDENPTYRREYLGEWVIDLDALVYKFRPERNKYSELPSGHDWQRILSIDYGYDDKTAFGITTYSLTQKKVFTEYVEGHSEMIPSEIAGRIDQLRERFKPFKIVADTGALGKMITQEMIRRYQIPIVPAEKKEKAAYISLMNGDFIDGRLLVHESLTELHDQYTTLVKGENHLEDPTLPNDLCDVALYGYREARHYLGETKKELKIETPEYWENEAKKIEERELEDFESTQSRPWWEDG